MPKARAFEREKLIGFRLLGIKLYCTRRCMQISLGYCISFLVFFGFCGYVFFETWKPLH